MIPEISFNNTNWVVDEDFIIMSIIIPKGFTTDLASVPRILWSIYPPFGKYQTAAIVHDYLYKTHYPRKEADKIFLEIMKKDEVSITTRNLFYLAVRLFGWITY